MASSSPPKRPSGTPPKRPSGSSKAAASASKLAAKPAGSSKPLPVFGIVVGAVVVLGVLAVALVLVGTRSSPPESDELAPVTVTGEALPTFPESGTDPAVGLAAPKLEGTSFDGSPVTLDPASGRPTIAVFLAHWCPVCQQELPMLTSWMTSGAKPAGVDVVAVSTGTSSARPNYPPSKWFASSGFPGPVLRDEATGGGAYKAESAYGLTAFPYWVFIDANGKVVARRTGLIETAALTEIANQLAAGTVPQTQTPGGPSTPADGSTTTTAPGTATTPAPTETTAPATTGS